MSRVTVKCYCMILKAELLNYERNICQVNVSMKIVIIHQVIYSMSGICGTMQLVDYYKKKDHSNKLVQKKGKN